MHVFDYCTLCLCAIIFYIIYSLLLNCYIRNILCYTVVDDDITDSTNRYKFVHVQCIVCMQYMCMYDLYLHTYKYACTCIPISMVAFVHVSNNILPTDLHVCVSVYLCVHTYICTCIMDLIMHMHMY